MSMSSSVSTLSSLYMASLRLPCGVSVNGRLARSATHEVMNPDQKVTDDYIALYEILCDNPMGLIITGNYTVDRRYNMELHNLHADPKTILSDEMEAFQKFTQILSSKKPLVMAQLNHPGRYSSKEITSILPTASSVPQPPAFMTGQLRSLRTAEVHDVIDRFAKSAELLKMLGFNGIQIHAAHGFLISEFMNSVLNVREDEYGSDRDKLLMDVYHAVRRVVGPTFPVSVKVSGGDGEGFGFQDCVRVCRKLADAGVDLIQISGGHLGTYITPYAGHPFLQSACAIKKIVSCPVMMAGGLREISDINSALEHIDIVAFGRPLMLDPLCVKKLANRQILSLPAIESDEKLFRAAIFERIHNHAFAKIWLKVQHLISLRTARKKLPVELVGHDRLCTLYDILRVVAIIDICVTTVKKAGYKAKDARESGQLELGMSSSLPFRSLSVLASNMIHSVSRETPAQSESQHSGEQNFSV